MTELRFTRISLEQVDEVMVVRFIDEKLIDETQAEQVKSDFCLLIDVDEPSSLKIVVDFEGVTYLSSIFLGALYGLNKAILSSRGKLCLCNIAPAIYEVFQITKLNMFYSIVEGREDALSFCNAS